MINVDLIKKYSGGNKSIIDFKGCTRKQIVKDAWEQSENIEEAEEFADRKQGDVLFASLFLLSNFKNDTWMNAHDSGNLSLRYTFYAFNLANHSIALIYL